MTDSNTGVKALLKAQAARRRAEAEELEALANALPEDGLDPFLDVEEAQQRHGIGRGSLKAAAERGDLELKRGPRGKLLVRASEIERWIESRPHVPRPRKAAHAADLDAWERETDADLRRMGERK